MKVLTVRQPYATLIVAGVKPVENRPWRAPDWLLGERFCVHAAKADTDNDRSIPEFAWDALGEIIGDAAPPRGKLVGSAVLIGCHHADDATCRRHEPDPQDGGLPRPFWPCSPRWANPDAHHWLLADSRPCDEVAMRGRQGLWDLPPWPYTPLWGLPGVSPHG